MTDLLVGELRQLERHLRLLFVRHDFVELALVGRLFDVAAGEEFLSRREIKVGFDRLTTMAVEAMLHQDRLDVLFEQGERLGRFLRVFRVEWLSLRCGFRLRFFRSK